jgi:hypothetical protein
MQRFSNCLVRNRERLTIGDGNWKGRMKMPDREKVIKGVHDARRYLEDREWFDKRVGVHIDALNDALAMLKEHEAHWVKKSGDALYCSRCNSPSINKQPYCCRCGSKMT